MSFWEDKKVFVTGATGFLGSWLTLRLIEKGAKIVFLDFPDEKRSILKESYPSANIQAIEGSLKNKNLIDSIFSAHTFDYIFHLAAQTQVTQALDDPVSTYEANTLGTLFLLESARINQKHIQGIIIASSDKAYGEQISDPFQEKHPLNPIYPYDVSKACAEMIGLSYFHTYGLPVVVTRCANIYGGGDFNFLRLIPYLIRCFLEDVQPVLRSDGTCVRDYLFVEDAIQGYLMLAEAMVEKKLQGEAFNFGTKNPKSVHAIFDFIRKLMDKKNVESISANRSKQEIKNQSLCSLKAYNALGWKPFFGLDVGLALTIDWYTQDKRKRNKLETEICYHRL